MIFQIKIRCNRRSVPNRHSR